MYFRLIALFCTALFLSAGAVANDDGPAARKVVLSLTTAAPTSPGVGQAPHDQQLIAMTTSIRPPAILTVSEIETTSHRPVRLRHIEYSEDQVVIVGLADDASERTRVIMTDPRLVRAEASYADDLLPSTTLYRPTVDFSVLIDDPSVTRIRVQKPRWTGTEWLFDDLAEAPLQ